MQMKGFLADFTQEKNIRKVAGMSDVVMRSIDEDTMVLQMLQHHEKNINMGLDDTRAPFFHDGVQHYLDNGYTVGTRNSGGRSVANDLGVLNFSLILQNNLSGAENYMMFFNFLKDALKPLNLEFKVGQVDGAYCPGKFDISVNGKKVAGTAQRRIGNRVLVGCYLSVNGDQNKRSQIISDFYKITQDVIEVFPEKLTTLQDEMKKPLEVETVKNLLIEQFKKLTSSFSKLDLSTLDEDAINQAMMRSKNQDTKYLNR
mgnify:CR=1 FL=1